METILRKPELRRFNNADHIEFHDIAYNICYQNRAPLPTDFLPNYLAKTTQENNIYKWMRRSEYTQKKADTDHQRDEIYRGLLGIVESNRKHFNPTMRDYAEHIYNLLANYGDLTQSGYDAETAGIDSITARLRSSDYAVAVQALALDNWISELVNLNTLFKTYAADTEQETVKKPDITSKQARIETDAALRKITNRFTALIDMNGAASYAGFIEAFYVHVDHYNTLVHEHYGRLHVRTDLTKADIAMIPAQPFTGQTIHVIPEVSLRKVDKEGVETIVRLDFSVDFTVSYQNNVGPGTATLVIKGIGGYVGEKTTTFNIE